MRTVGFIFARGGSKGVPRKNLKPLAGKPLIAHAIHAARACPAIDTVIVSTDDPAIASVATECGAEVPFLRPEELATDTSPEWLSWQHALRWVQEHRGAFDVFVSVPPTSPFRSVGDITACIERLHADPPADIVLTVRVAERSPYFNMVTVDQEGYARLVIPPGQAIARRQDCPAVFDITTVAYAARPTYILGATGLFDGRVGVVQVPTERAMDIDTEFDFLVADCIARRQC